MTLVISKPVHAVEGILRSVKKLWVQTDEVLGTVLKASILSYGSQVGCKAKNARELRDVVMTVE
ncbi:MAG: hypothetical protein AB7L71_00920 [Vicinamibacterales bacterium]